MRYHYERPKKYSIDYGETYKCNHPVYDYCTLFKIEDRGLAVIQQRYDPINKHTYWTELDPWIPEQLYLQVGFLDYFDKLAGVKKDDLYPTVTVRQIMWALKMKPLKRNTWETTFDKKGF